MSVGCKKNPHLSFTVLYLEQSQKEKALTDTHEQDVTNLKGQHENDIKALHEEFNTELQAERIKLEEEKKNDLDRLKAAMDGSISEQQKLQLSMLQDEREHERELENVRQELVEAHMKKFTDMASKLEEEHKVKNNTCIISMMYNHKHHKHSYFLTLTYILFWPNL